MGRYEGGMSSEKESVIGERERGESLSGEKELEGESVML